MAHDGPPVAGGGCDSTPGVLEVRFNTGSGGGCGDRDGNYVTFPIDTDISTNASTTEPDYAPCISCHDPHGTNTPDHHGSATTQSNFMLRYTWISNSDLCIVCH